MASNPLSKAADDAAARLYGDVLAPELRAACRRNGVVFAVCSGVGLVVQLASLASAQLYPVCVVVYFLYNVCTMVLVRITTAAFKFEDPALLKVCLGMCLAMVLYALSVAATLSAWDSENAIVLMGLGGVVNALVALPTEMRECYYLISARSRGIGVDKMVELGPCEKAAVNAFLAFCILLCFGVYGNVAAVHALGDGRGPQFNSLLVFYMLTNLIPFAAPKFFHLMQTETRIWPLKLLLFNFGQAFVAIFAIGSCVPKADARSFQVAFGVMGTLNGLLIGAMFAAISAQVLFFPRTDQRAGEPEAKAACADDTAV